MKDNQMITLTSELNENKFMLQQAREECAHQKRTQVDLEQQVKVNKMYWFPFADDFGQIILLSSTKTHRIGQNLDHIRL